MVSFFSENYYIYHYSNSMSNAFIFLVILILFSILLPFFTNIGILDKFWKPNKIYTEHPIVQFKDKFIIELSNSNGATLTFKSNKLSDNNSILTSCSIETQDYSNKDIINLIKIKGKIITTDFLINEIKFFFFFDYYMTENVNINLTSNAHIFYSNHRNNDNNIGITKFSSNGDLILKQNKGLVETYFISNENSNSNIEDEMDKVINNPFNRNDNYYFQYKNNFISVNKGQGRIFDFEIVINIPYYQDIIVQLPNYTNLKNKWVLYSILFFPTLYVCYWLMGLVINNQIFKTRIKSDIPIKI